VTAAPALSLEGVRAAYGDRRALDGVDLAVPAGALVALLGPNGAGKSTVVALAAGLKSPTDGRVRVCGRDPRADRGARRLVGLAAQEIGLYPPLGVRANLRAVGELHGLRPAAARAAADALLGAFGLEGIADRAAGTLSGGERRRAHAAAALVHSPRLALLDEPTAGADPRTRDAILGAVRDLAAGGTAVVYTTHYLPEVERLGADVVVLEAGRAIASAPVAELAGRHGGLEAAYLALTGRPGPQEWA